MSFPRLESQGSSGSLTRLVRRLSLSDNTDSVKEVARKASVALGISAPESDERRESRKSLTRRRSSTDRAPPSTTLIESVEKSIAVWRGVQPDYAPAKAKHVEAIVTLLHRGTETLENVFWCISDMLGRGEADVLVFFKATWLTLRVLQECPCEVLNQPQHDDRVWEIFLNIPAAVQRASRDECIQRRRSLEGHGLGIPEYLIAQPTNAPAASKTTAEPNNASSAAASASAATITTASTTTTTPENGGGGDGSSGGSADIRLTEPSADTGMHPSHTSHKEGDRLAGRANVSDTGGGLSSCTNDITHDVENARDENTPSIERKPTEKDVLPPAQTGSLIDAAKEGATENSKRDSRRKSTGSVGGDSVVSVGASGFEATKLALPVPTSTLGVLIDMKITALRKFGDVDGLWRKEGGATSVSFDFERAVQLLEVLEMSLRSGHEMMEAFSHLPQDNWALWADKRSYLSPWCRLFCVPVLCEATATAAALSADLTPLAEMLPRGAVEGEAENPAASSGSVSGASLLRRFHALFEALEAFHVAVADFQTVNVEGEAIPPLPQRPKSLFSPMEST